MLYSLWNGKPASLVEVLNLDYSLREDLCSVILGFGYSPNPFCNQGSEFFYRAVSDAVRDAGLFDWFVDADGGDQ